ncbi:hypothetical protein OAL74_02115 [Candidatus Pelagibacter sp.]|nr:hypothetical protein [Candidatus Pelagibacter sp.]
MKKTIKIIMTFDIDPDDHYLPRSDRKKNHWRGLSMGSKIITMELKKRFKKFVPISWFVRVDDEIKNDFGSYLGLFQKYKKIFNYLKKKNGKFYLHPHLFKFDKKEGVWNQETNDKKNLLQLNKIYSEKKLSKFVNLKVIRIGGHYSTKKILKFLSMRDVFADCSSLPGRKGNYDRPFNWMNTKKIPHYIYFSRSHKLLEIPPSMIKIKADYDKKAYPRYLDLTFKSDLFSKSLGTLNLKSKNLITISHPCQLLNNNKNSHGLLGYGINNFIKNLNNLISYLKKKNISYKFDYIENVNLK